MATVTKKEKTPSELVALLHRQAMKAPQSIRKQAIVMAEILTVMRDAGTKQRRLLSRHIEETVSADVAARVTACVERNAGDISELYGIFKNWIDQETELVRIKFMACSRCPQPTRGAVSIAGIGWLCREHYRNYDFEMPTFEKTKPVNPSESIFGLTKENAR